MYICLTFGFQDLNSQHIDSDFCFNHTRNLGHNIVRCVIVHLLSELEFPTHLFWLLLWSNKISQPYRCQMCGCTFAWHLAFKTWIPNTSILTFALIKQEISAMSVSDVWMYICLTFGFKDLNSQHIYFDFCFDQLRNLGHISVRCVDVHLVDIWLSRPECPTHRFWLLLQQQPNRSTEYLAFCILKL